MATYGYTPYGTDNQDGNNYTSGNPYTATGYYSWDNRFKGYGGYQQYSWANAYYSPYRNANNYQNYLDELEEYRKAKKKAEREKTHGINSLADVLLNTDGKIDKYGPINNPLDWLVSTGRSAWDYYKDSYVKPLFEGDFKRVFVNALTAVGEDLDIVANPIKGMINEADSGLASAVAGIAGAVVGGVAVFATGGTALVPILSGAAVGAGVSAASAALLTDSEKALLGAGRAIGVTGEGRYNYNLETGHWLTDIVSEIVIDPFNWVTFGQKAAAHMVSKEMSEALGKATGKTLNQVAAKQELKNVAHTFADYFQLGTRSLSKVEDVWSKAAWKANPLAVPLKTGKMLWESEWTSTLVHNIKKSALGIYDDIADGIMKHSDITSKVKSYHALFEDSFDMQALRYKWTNLGRPELFADFPSDTTAINNFIGNQYEYYIKRFPNKTGLELQDIVYQDFRKILDKVPVSDHSAIVNAAERSLANFKMPIDELGIEAVDEVARKMVMAEYMRFELARDLTKDAAKTTELIRRYVGDSTNKLEVIQKSEEMLRTTMDLKDATIYDIIKTIESDGTVKGFYDPKLTTVEQMFERYGITMDDLKGYILKDEEVINSLRNSATWYSGAGATEVAELTKKDIIPDNIGKDMDKFSQMTKDSLEHSKQQSHGISKAVQEYSSKTFHAFTDNSVARVKDKARTTIIKEGASISDKTTEDILELFTPALYSKGSKSALALTSATNKVRELNQLAKTLVDLDPEITKRTEHLLTTTATLTNNIKTAVESVSSFNSLAKELKSKLKIRKYTELPRAIDNLKKFVDDKALYDDKLVSEALTRRITNLSTIASNLPKILRDYNEYVTALRSFRTDNATVLERLIDLGDTNSVSLFNSVAELLTPEVNNIRLGAVQKLISATEGGAYLMQSNNRAVHLLLLSETMSQHGAFIDELAKDTGGIGKVLENYSLLEANTDGMRRFITSAKHIRQTAKATQNYAGFSKAITNYVNTAGVDERVYNVMLDVIEEYNTRGMRTSEVLAELGLGHVSKRLKEKLSYLNIKIDDLTTLDNILSDYINKQADIGMSVPIIRLFDGTAAEQSKIFIDSVIKPFFEDLADVSKFDLAENLDALRDTTAKILTGVDQTNKILTDKIVDGHKISRNASFNAVKVLEDEYFKKFPFMKDDTSYLAMYQMSKVSKSEANLMQQAYREMAGVKTRVPKAGGGYEWIYLRESDKGLLQKQKELAQNILEENRVNPVTFNMEDSIFGIKSYDRTREGQILEKARFYNEAGESYFMEISPTVSSMRDVVYAKVKASNGNLMIADMEKFLTPEEVASGRAVLDILDAYHVHNFSEVEDVVADMPGFKKELDFLNKIQSDYKMAVASLDDFVSGMEIYGDSIYMRSEGFDIMQQNLAGAFNAMPVEDFVSIVKYNTNGSNTFLLQKDLIPAGLRKDLVDDLTKYGIQLDEVGDMVVVHKVADTPAFAELPISTNRYGITPETGAEVAQLKHMQRLMDETSKLARNKIPLDASVYMPTYLGTDGIAKWVSENTDIANIIDVDAYLKSVHSAREPILSFIARYDTMKEIAGEGMIAGSPAKNLFNNAASTVLRAEDQMKYLNIHFDKRFRLTNLFSHLDDNTIIEMSRKNKHLRFAYLDKKGKVHNINIKNKATLDFARQAKAVVTTTNNYNQMYKHINQYSLKNLPGGKVLDGFRRIVQTPFTAMYFSNPGTVIRNLYDASIKNMIISGNADVIGDSFNAFKMIDEVNDMVKEIMLRSDNQFTELAINEFFGEIADETTRKLMRNKFDLVQEYINSGAASGPLAAMRDGIQSRAATKYGDAVNTGTKWENLWWENPMTKRFMNAFGNVEDSARFGLWLNLKKTSPLTDAEIVDTIISTHFDYSTKTVAEIYGQVVVPFITFPIRNFQWWADHAMDSPLITRALIVSAQEDWTEDHYNWENRYTNDYNFSQLMSGNWQATRNNYSHLVKLNPSLFDAFSLVPGLVMDPASRVSAPLKNIARLATGDFESLEYPAQANIKRAGNMLTSTLPALASGDLNYLRDLVPSVFNTHHYEPRTYSYEDRSRRSHPDNAGRYYVPFYSRQTGIVSGTKDYRNQMAKDAYYGGRGQGTFAGTSYASYGYSKGNGYASGYGYGNPRYRKWDTGIHLAYGRRGAYLRNAPEGTRLINPITRSHLKRSMYAKMYSKAGNSRLINRTRTIDDPRGLMFRLQDLKYNVF